MQLIGDISADRPLIVAALAAEVAELQTDWPVLLTGVGKVAAATAVSRALLPQRPGLVVNVGTAGALHDGLWGAHWITSVDQHDFDRVVVRDITGDDSQPPISLPSLPGRDDHENRTEQARPIRLVTGDRFVQDADLRAALAARAELCDMEGYAVAFAAGTAGVPVAMLKYVSDPATEVAGRSWQESVRPGAIGLANALRVAEATLQQLVEIKRYTD